jgi:hypothetical protein
MGKNYFKVEEEGFRIRDSFSKLLFFATAGNKVFKEFLFKNTRCR